ncbi:MAG TPA: hypothetical protein VFJ27_07145 [Terriglobia bacterium]|nr:hypothetical protein [Terriglobia bacterium]
MLARNPWFGAGQQAEGITRLTDAQRFCFGNVRMGPVFEARLTHHRLNVAIIHPVSPMLRATYES